MFLHHSVSSHSLSPATIYSPTQNPRSTIDAEGLHDRGRHGNGWIPFAVITGLRSRTFPGLVHEPRRAASPGTGPRPPPPKPARSMECLESSHARSISRGQLQPLPTVHRLPIALVVSQEPSERLTPLGRAHLEAGFPLRCFQRFSRPHVATQPCRWHDNWSTSGVSIPVLSY